MANNTKVSVSATVAAAVSATDNAPDSGTPDSNAPASGEKATREHRPLTISIGVAQYNPAFIALVVGMVENHYQIHGTCCTRDEISEAIQGDSRLQDFLHYFDDAGLIDLAKGRNGGVYPKGIRPVAGGSDVKTYNLTPGDLALVRQEIELSERKLLTVPGTKRTTIAKIAAYLERDDASWTEGKVSACVATLGTHEARKGVGLVRLTPTEIAKRAEETAKGSLAAVSGDTVKQIDRKAA